MTANTKIYILSAGDRNNYGDLLFPIIARHEFLNMGMAPEDILNIGIIDSNLEDFGALPTHKYNTLYKSGSNANRFLLIAGGEVIGPRWFQLYSYIYSSLATIRRKKILNPFMERFIKSLFAHKEAYPYFPTSSKILDRYRLLFNGVGGSNIQTNDKQEFQRVKYAFEQSKYFTVRSDFDKEKLNSVFQSDKVNTAPDSAILMSKYFTFNKEKGSKPYIVFQVGGHKTNGQIQTIKEQLEKLSLTFNFPIHLLPIGLCPGHDDLEPLKWLQENLNCERKMVYPENLTETMRTIAGSNLFIGTSLHGIITSMSFNVPYIGANPQVHKLQNYLETWSFPPFDRMKEFGEIFVHGKKILSEDWVAKLKENRNRQVERASQSFKNMEKIIRSNPD